MKTILKYILMATIAITFASCGSAPSGSADILDATRPAISAPIDPTGIEDTSKEIGKEIKAAKESAKKAQSNIERLERNLEEAKGFNDKMTAVISLIGASNEKASAELESIQLEFETFRLRASEDVNLAKNNLKLTEATLLRTDMLVLELEGEINTLKGTIEDNKVEIVGLRKNEKVAVDLLRDSEEAVGKALEKEQKLKIKIEKQKKYVWLVWSFGVWTLVKLLGTIGMWSPQGRVAKFLVG
tara:strand:- start:1294 stop:2022 length:729 start_codon:yes stop_codon:yes gene_type:complete